jgi:hypothetical protein
MSATATITRTATRTITPTQSITTTRALPESDIDPVLGGDLRVENDAIRVQVPARAYTMALRVKFDRAVTDISKDDRRRERVVNRFTLRAFELPALTREITQFNQPISITVQYDLKS